MIGLNELAKDIAFANNAKGFAFTKDEIHQKLLLAISEICEAQEELRDGKGINEIYYESDGVVKSEMNNKIGKPCGFPVEIADAIIRLLHICSNFGIDIEAVILNKLKYNATRPMKHGRQF